MRAQGPQGLARWIMTQGPKGLARWIMTQGPKGLALRVIGSRARRSA